MLHITFLTHPLLSASCCHNNASWMEITQTGTSGVKTESDTPPQPVSPPHLATRWRSSWTVCCTVTGVRFSSGCAVHTASRWLYPSSMRCLHNNRWVMAAECDGAVNIARCYNVDFTLTAIGGRALLLTCLWATWGTGVRDDGLRKKPQTCWKCAACLLCWLP